jgi:hypothetical protein
MEQAPEAPAEAPAALEHDIVLEDGEHTKYPAPLSTHEKVLEDKELFLALLQDLCTKLQDAEPKLWRPTKFRVPTGALPTLQTPGTSSSCPSGPEGPAPAYLQLVPKPRD